MAVTSATGGESDGAAMKMPLREAACFTSCLDIFLCLESLRGELNLELPMTSDVGIWHTVHAWFLHTAWKFNPLFTTTIAELQN